MIFENWRRGGTFLYKKNNELCVTFYMQKIMHLPLRFYIQKATHFALLFYMQKTMHFPLRFFIYKHYRIVLIPKYKHTYDQRDQIDK